MELASFPQSRLKLFIARQRIGDAMTASTDRISLPAAEGATLNVHRCLAPKGRAVVQINHDLGEHGGRYDDFVRYLARHGFHVYAPDHRGHGRTSVPGA